MAPSVKFSIWEEFNSASFLAEFNVSLLPSGFWV